jgi:hypothetical protein
MGYKQKVQKGTSQKMKIKYRYLHETIMKDVPKPSKEHTKIIHMNKVKTDNRLCNLKWVTKIEYKNFWENDVLDQEGEELMKSYNNIINAVSCNS